MSREDLRRRFIKAETTLFRVRYDRLIDKERKAFLNSRDFNWTPVKNLLNCQRDQYLITFRLKTKKLRNFQINWKQLTDQNQMAMKKNTSR